MTKKTPKIDTALERIDNALAELGPDDWMVQRATEDADGFLSARAIVTNVGVFTYLNQDGSQRRELRLPEEVFSEESLASLALAPLTLMHPAEPVTPDNVGTLAVGSLGEYSHTDGYRVSAKLRVNRADAIQAVKDGTAKALSCGYRCDIEWTSGNWMGMDYDCIQRNIRYNHVALVPVGRAGDEAVIHTDQAGTPCLPAELNTDTKENPMEIIRIDGAEYKADAQVASRLRELEGANATLTKDLEASRADAASLKESSSKMEAERDSLKERVDALEKAQPEAIEKAVAERLDIMDACRKAGVEVKADMAVLDMKKAVIAAKCPACNLDGKDEAYISARFDGAMEMVAAEAEKAANEHRADAADVPAGEPKNELQEAQARYNARMDSAWQDPKN